MNALRRVLFVCMGNICRSPAAEGLFRALVDEQGLDARIEIDSAGTIAYHAGEPPDPRMRQAAAARGHTLTGRARPVIPEDFRRFDLIVAMDRENLADLREMADALLEDGREERARLSLLSDFLPAGAPRDVPDPYYGGAAGFDTQGMPLLAE